MNARQSLLPTVMTLLSAISAFAQTSMGIRNAVYVPKTTETPAHIESVFSAICEMPQAVAAAQDVRKYRIVDLYGGPNHTFAPVELAIDRVVVPAISWLSPEDLNTVQLIPSADLPAIEEDRYIVIVSGLSIGKESHTCGRALEPKSRSTTT